jgi:hypothetical protein
VGPVGPITKFQVSQTNTTVKLLGLLVWIQDYPNGPTGMPRRIGTFSDPGVGMTVYPWSSCGGDSTLVHKEPLDADAGKTPVFTWNAPKAGVQGGAVEVRGVCVVEDEGGINGGFGKFAVKIPVTGPVVGTGASFAAAGLQVSGGVGRESLYVSVGLSFVVGLVSFFV